MSLPDLLGARPDAITLSVNEVARYSRHLIMPEVGVDGQKRLKAASVLLIGAGGLGSPLALYLGAAGIGRLGLIDFDIVDFSNLQRQVLHGTADVGRPKLLSARDRIAAINPEVRVDLYDERLSSSNVMRIFEPYDIIIDGTDNFPTRYLVNDACVLLGKPNAYGSIFRFEGQASVFATKDGPCYRCLYPEPPPPGLVPSCAEGGVLGVLPGLIGTIQATEALKLILGVGESLAGRLLLIDALTMRFRTMHVKRDPQCPACGTRTLTALVDYDEFCGTPGGELPSDHDDVEEITPANLAERLKSGADFDLIDVREPGEWEVAHLPTARLIPLGTLAASMGELDATRELVVMCRSGKRSADAVRRLQAAGFRRVKNLAGGILRWSDDVDPSVPKY